MAKILIDGREEQIYPALSVNTFTEKFLDWLNTHPDRNEWHHSWQPHRTKRGLVYYATSPDGVRHSFEYQRR